MAEPEHGPQRQRLEQIIKAKNANLLLIDVLPFLRELADSNDRLTKRVNDIDGRAAGKIRDGAAHAGRPCDDKT